jgi:protease I
VPVAALKLAGADVDIVSLHAGRIRGVNLHEPASMVRVDKTLDQVSPAMYDGLLIRGGFINPDLLRQSAEARDFVRTFDRQGKPIATLCHGPWLLSSAGLMSGRTMTSWPGIWDDMVNAGATLLDQKVVRHGNWVTSRGPQDMVPFVEAMTELSSGAAGTQVVNETARSDPQRDQPASAGGQCHALATTSGIPGHFGSRVAWGGDHGRGPAPLGRSAEPIAGASSARPDLGRERPWPADLEAVLDIA